MTLRAKTLALVCATLLALVAVLYLSSETIVLRGFAHQEDQETRRNVARALAALDDDLAKLDGTTRDWSAWDDTYAFVQDHNQGYVRSNLVNDSPLISNKLNVMLFVDESGHPVFEKGYDLVAGRSVDVPAGLHSHVIPGDPLLAHPDVQGSTRGLLELPEGTLLVVSQAILTSQNQGPSRGSLIFGRFLDQAQLQRLSKQTALSLDLRRIEDPNLAPDFAAARAGLSDQAPVVVRTPDEDTVAGYALLKDVYGRDAFLLRAATSRDVYREGQATVVYALGALLLSGVLFGALILLLIERLVLARVAGLSREVGRVATSGDLSLRVAVSGRDELARLAAGINEMLRSLQTAQERRHEAEEALAHSALHDGLTGLPNRTLLRDRLEHAMARGRREGDGVALLLLDLDRFKAVNDSLGHQAGDRLLEEVANRLRGGLRATDTIARLGGDEFAIVVTPIDPAGAITAALRIGRLLETPIALAEQPVTVGASIGIAVFPEHADDADTLLRRADLAMYAAKAAGSGHATYAPEQEHATARLALESELRVAIEQDQLTLYYQPRVATRDGRVRGVEALVRWRHPERGLVPPDEFIPLAEETGLIAPLTRWVLGAALRQGQAWRAAGVELPIAVNLSMRNLHDPELPETVAALLAGSDVTPDGLFLEITESAAMADPQRTIEALARLAAMGVWSGIDDFGTGYSSLLYLKRLPVRQIKIDRTFVKDMTADESSLTIVRSTIDLGHNLGLEVVAEGVEDRASWDQLAALGCDAAQGYFLGRPMPPDDFLSWYHDFQAAAPLATAADQPHESQHASLGRQAS